MKKFFKSIGSWLAKALGVDDSSELGEYFSGVLGNWSKKYGETDITDREKASTDYQVAAQNMLNEQEYDRKVDFFERFESPQARVRQFKEAGLNPMLLAGNGASVSASGGVGSPGAASAPASSPESGLAGIIGTIMQVKNFQLQKRSIESEILKRETETSANRIENKYKEKANQLRLKSMEQEIALSKSQETLNMATVKKVVEEAKFAETYALYAPQLFDSQIFQMNTTSELNQARAERERVEASVSEERKKEIKAVTAEHWKSVAVMDATIDKINAECYELATRADLNEQMIKESKSRIEKMEAEVKQIGAEIGLTELDTKYYVWNHSKDVSNKLPFGMSVHKEAFVTNRQSEKSMRH